MKLLFCCEYYHPSRGGVQEVMRQIAERMVVRGHDVTVATTRMDERDFTEWNGVKIEEFDCSGNAVRGMLGELDRYRAYLKKFSGDAIMIKAAQQWTFDAAVAVLDDIPARKVFIPCGFSGLFEPSYKAYFKEMPEALGKCDLLIFYAEDYRDINMAKEHGIEQLTVLPNGASDIEFAVERDPTFRSRHGIPEDDLVVLTVGTPINAKGHTELAAAFALLPESERSMTLILNGQWPKPQEKKSEAAEHDDAQQAVRAGVAVNLPGLISRARRLLASQGPAAFAKRGALSLFWRTRGAILKPIVWSVGAAQWTDYRVRLQLARLRQRLTNSTSAAPVPQPPVLRSYGIEHWIDMAEQQPGKRVLKSHFSREETVQAFLNADLFVFASNIEYSPLVLYEAVAAGLPFLSVPVGNAEEIARWTGAGVICPADKDARGYTRVDPAVLAERMAQMLGDPQSREALSAAGREAWRQEFNWSAIALRYEDVLRGGTGELDRDEAATDRAKTIA